MPLTTNYNICATLQALQAYLLGLVSQYLRKLALLQRLAAIIEQAGDAIAIPNLENLIPLGLLDASNYNQIRCACPFLGLPPLTAAETELDDLKDLVGKGYQALDQLLANHPYARLNQLQDSLDQLLAQIEQQALNAISPGLDVIACLDAICQGLDQLQIYTEGYVNSAVGEYNSLTAPNSSVTLLTPLQMQKSALIANSRATLASLSDLTPAPPPPEVSALFN